MVVFISGPKKARCLMVFRAPVALLILSCTAIVAVPPSVTLCPNNFAVLQMLRIGDPAALASLVLVLLHHVV